MSKFKKASDIKVGVVGYGGAFNMGRAHLKEMRDAGMTPVAVAEIDPKRLAVATEDFPGIATYSTVQEMLRKSDVNLVTIITPHNTHASIALKCLGTGCHVVCEKPMAITTAECDSMMAMARRKRCVLTTYHNRHWDGAVLQAMEEIRRGVIGEVFRAEAHIGQWGQPNNWWRSSRSVSGGILYDWGVHLLEYSLQVLDSKIVEVSGFSREGFWAPKTAWKRDANEDEAFAVVRFSSGAWLTLCISSIDSKPKKSFVEFTGTKGTFVMLNPREYEVTTHGRKGTTLTRWGMRESEGRRFYQNLASHLVDGKKLIITPEWARRPIHILDLAVQSAKKGTSLKAKYP